MMYLALLELASIKNEKNQADCLAYPGLVGHLCGLLQDAHLAWVAHGQDPTARTRFFLFCS